MAAQAGPSPRAAAVAWCQCTPHAGAGASTAQDRLFRSTGAPLANIRSAGGAVTHSSSPQVWELVNLAYAEHEIISDYTTAAFMWFEGG